MYFSCFEASPSSTPLHPALKPRNNRGDLFRGMHFTFHCHGSLCSLGLEEMLGELHWMNWDVAIIYATVIG